MQDNSKGYIQGSVAFQCFPSPPLNSSPLLLILPSLNEIPLLLQQPPQILINRKRHRLPGRHSHNSRRDTLVKTASALLLPHLARDLGDAAKRCVTRFRGRLLQSCLDGVDGCVGEGTHGAGDEADGAGLPAGEVDGALVVLEGGAEVGVGCEVGYGKQSVAVEQRSDVMEHTGLVGSLSQCGQ
jgi:hypothetical protein